MGGTDRRPELFMRAVGEFRMIESQPRLARAGAGAMTAVAVFRQDRLHRLVEGEAGPKLPRTTDEQQRRHAQRRTGKYSPGAPDPMAHPGTLPLFAVVFRAPR